MGCGQSKIHLYPRKNKSKANVKKNGHNEDNDADEEEGHNQDEQEKNCSNEKEKIKSETLLTENSSASNGEIAIPILRRNGPLLQSQEISTSQQNFFRMLDEKIDQGPDYDSSSETEIALEEARLNALIQHWESASLTASMCSSTSRSLQGTPVRQANFRPQLRPGFPGLPLNMEFKQLQEQQQLVLLKAQQPGMINSPTKRDNVRPMATQSMMHQAYGSMTATTSQVSSFGMNRNLRTLPPQPIPPAQTNTFIPTMAFYSQPPQSYFGEVLHPKIPQNNSDQPRFPPQSVYKGLLPRYNANCERRRNLLKTHGHKRHFTMEHNTDGRLQTATDT